MNQDKRNKLIEAGINVEDVMERLNDNEMLLDRLLGKFLDNNYVDRLTDAFLKEDYPAALEISHAFKGVSGNLSMTRLFSLLTLQVNELRADHNREANDLMNQIIPEFTHVSGILRDLLSGN